MANLDFCRVFNSSPLCLSVKQLFATQQRPNGSIYIFAFNNIELSAGL